MEEDVLNALKKCAVGFGTSEVVEEFAVDDGELRLIKKKVTRRDIPPDIKAVKMLMDESEVSSLTDEELGEEMKKLKEMLGE
jgi:hypothetical protein